MNRRLTRLFGGIFGGEPNYLRIRHPDLDSFMGTMSSLGDDDAQVLAELWDREDADARQVAWANARKAIEEAGHVEALDEFRAAVGAWAQSRPGDFQGIQGFLGSSGAPASGRQAAAPAIIDKAAAILGRHAMTEVDYLVLARPWDSLHR